MTSTTKRDPTLDLAEGDAVEILNGLVALAVKARASDIHLEPKHDQLRVRLRVDGAMADVQGIDAAVGLQVLSRIKVLARMDFSERRVPQDGQLALEIGGERVHLRASTFPAAHGEKTVLRVLAGNHYLRAFKKLGLDHDAQDRIKDFVTRPQGFIVTSGPTGAGKTSTLYAFLELIDTREVNVVTLEDPLEVEIYGITQGQVNTRTGFTFATGLRAILRQDPDVILVGEIRDAETAAIAMQAALTGHLVMSTLHTSDTVETIVRLVDLGVEPWIVANALTAVLSQRLVRIACPNCAETTRLDGDFWDGDEVLLAAGSQVVRPKGCDQCMRTGYRGRTGIFEILELDDELRELIKLKAATRAYREIFARRKIKSLRRVGFESVLSGITTIDEVRRVTT